jgi:hypothetical protein
MALYGFDRCKSKAEITPEKIGAKRDDWMPTAREVGAVGYNISIDSTTEDILSWALGQTHPTSISAGHNVKNAPFVGYWIFRVEIGGDGGNNWRVLHAYNVSFGQFNYYVNMYVNTDWSGWTTGFLPISGGMLSGDLTVNKGVPNLHFVIPDTDANASIYKNTSDTVDYGIFILDRSTDQKRMALRLSASEQKAQIIIRSSANANDVHHDIYGTHNILCGTTEPTSLANGCIYEMYE